MDLDDQTANMLGEVKRADGQNSLSHDQKIRAASWQWRHNKLITNDPNLNEKDLAYAGIIKGVRVAGSGFVIDGLKENLKCLKKVLERGGMNLPPGAERHLNAVNERY